MQAIRILTFLVFVFVMRLAFCYAQNNVLEKHFDLKSRKLTNMSTDHKFITNLTTNIFDQLGVPKIPCEFQEEDGEVKDAYAKYDSTLNKLIFFDSQIKNLNENVLAWLTWHESLHYYHELKQGQDEQFYDISNIDEFDFKDNADHKSVVKDIVNDIYDWIIESHIASLNQGIKPNFQKRIEFYESMFRQFNEKVVTQQNMRGGVLIDLIKIALIIKFSDLPKESEIRQLYKYLPEWVSREEVLSNLSQLSYKYPNNNPQLICKIFNMMSPRYKLTFEQKYIKELKSAEKDFSFWIKQKNIKRVWTFLLHDK